MGAGMVLPVCAGMEWGVGMPTMNGYAHAMPDSTYLVGSMELSQTNCGRHAPYNVEQPDEQMSNSNLIPLNPLNLYFQTTMWTTVIWIEEKQRFRNALMFLD